MNSFLWSVRVYYEDTDAGGVVYYANYLKFMERARTEWLRALGVEQDDLRQEEGVLLMVHGLSVRYRQPAKFNDALVVTLAVQELGRAKVVFVQRVMRHAEVLCESQVTIACVDEQTGKARKFPERLSAVLKGVNV